MKKVDENQSLLKSFKSNHQLSSSLKGSLAKTANDLNPIT